MLLLFNKMSKKSNRKGIVHPKQIKMKQNCNRRSDLEKFDFGTWEDMILEE